MDSRLLQLDSDQEERLEALARLTGRSKGFLVSELERRIEAGVAELEAKHLGDHQPIT